MIALGEEVVMIRSSASNASFANYVIEWKQVLLEKNKEQGLQGVGDEAF